MKPEGAVKGFANNYWIRQEQDTCVVVLSSPKIVS